MESVKLFSNNVYYYENSKNDFIPFGFIVDGNNTFKGGFLGLEATRKYAAFCGLNHVEIRENVSFDMSELKLEEFAEKLSSASKLFIDGFHKLCIDNRDADGTDSKSESCDDRNRYYKTVGIECAFKSNRQFHVGLFVANHVSIFGVSHFATTFFRGRDVPAKDDELDTSEIFQKNVYSKCGFKAPAAYVRAFLKD